MWIRSALIRRELTNHNTGEVRPKGVLNGVIEPKRTIAVYSDQTYTDGFPSLVLSKISTEDAVMAKLKGYTVYESLKQVKAILQYPISRISRSSRWLD